MCRSKYLSFYEYYNSKEPFNEIKNNRPRFDEELKKKTERVIEKNK